MRAMFQAPALWINEPLDPALPWHDMETKHKSGLKFLHEAIKKAKMTWTRPSVEPRESFRSSSV